MNRRQFRNYVRALLAILILAASACAAAPVGTSLAKPDYASASFLAKTLPRSAQRVAAPLEDVQSIDPPAELQVTATQPSDGATETDPFTEIVVAFSRPVVALTGVDEQADLPQPLAFSPEVQGSGQWLSTSVFVFEPDSPLLGATEYTVTVQETTAADGAQLAESYVFGFTTSSPTVIDATPTGERIAPDTDVTVTFSQPMDADATAKAFGLYLLDDGGDSVGEPIPGTITFDEAVHTLIFTPTNPLAFGDSYLVSVSKDAAPASGTGELRDSFRSLFTVAPYPDIVSVTPADGAANVSPDTSVVIQFNTTVSPTQALQEVSVSPVLSTTSVYSYYSPYNDELMLSWYKQPNTQYTVTVGGDIEDEYGNTLGEDHTFTFTTGDYTPFVNLELERFTHFTASDDVRVSLLYRNVDDVDVYLYRLPKEELLRLSGADQWEAWDQYALTLPEMERVWSRTYDTSGDPNVTIRQIITLTDALDNPLSPGAYFLDVDSPDLPATDGAPQREQAALIVSDANLVVKKARNGQSLAWLTDLTSGEPVADAPVSFFMEGEAAGEGQTDSDGVALIDLKLATDTGWKPLIAISGEEGSSQYAVASSDWNNGIGPWDFGLMSGWGGEPIKTHFYTDRPIYRPGDTVYWKGIVRALVQDVYELPPGNLPIAVTVRNDMGTVIAQESVTPNELGTVNGEFVLSPEAGTGFYYMETKIGSDEATAQFGGVGFQVAEYRKPEFEITVESEEPQYIQGDTVRIDVGAQYFSGAPLRDAPLTWRLIADPYTFSWTDDDGRSYSFSPFDPESASYDPYRGFAGLGFINEGAGVTDENGSYVIELPADISQSLSSQNWAFDVTVQSGTNQFVSGRTTVPVHRASYYIGLAPRSYVTQVGTEAEVDVIALTPEYEPYAGADVDIVIHNFNWNSVYEQAADGSFRWETTVERTPVYTTTLTTNRSGQAILTWTPEQGGQYQVVASGTDEAGNPTSSADFLWVSAVDADEYVAWPMENNDRIEIVADKQAYELGDTAKILIPSPFQGDVRALITEERSGVLNAEVRKLQANSEMLELPITDAHIPNVYVNVILAKGVDDSNLFPAIRVGYTMLAVDTSSVELSVDVEPSASELQPGESLTYTLSVFDSEGRPAANAEVSAALVDKAILTLAGADDGTMMEAFYSQRPLDVSTGASLVINRDRLSQQLSEGAKGGGGGPGGGLEVRSDFRDLAYWAADLLTDENGEITFTVDLPDSLTTWRLIAKAVTDDTKVGEAALDVIATKQLQVRPLVPRFLTAGDRPMLGAQVINASEESVTGILTYTVTGAEFADGQTELLEFSLKPGEQTSELWPATVSTVTDTASILAVAAASNDASKNLSDALTLSMPVQRYESPETVATAGTVPPEGVIEQIIVPQMATDQGELSVRMEPSLAAGMLEGLYYLQHYPYECNEQVVSRFLPNLVTVRASRVLDIEDPELEAQLSYQLGIGVQRLVSRQNPDGGWGYWPGEDSSPFITAYVLWGVSLAEELGYAVPSNTRDFGIEYLDSRFEPPQATTESWRMNEMAFVHYVLSELDAGDPGRASTLYDMREKLGVYGKALLAMALDNMNEADAPDIRVETLLDDIGGASILSVTGAHWEEQGIDFQTLNTDTRSTSIALEALTRLRPDEPMLPQVVRWLMVTREAGRWSNTQENAWAIIGLTDWMTASGELDADYDWTVKLNQDEIGSGTAMPGQVNPPTDLIAPIAELLREEVNELAFSRTTDNGQLYYTTQLRYYLDAAAIDMRDRGIVIERRFALASDAANQPVTTASVGDVLSVTVTLVAPTDLHHVLAEAPLPAGLEPIDPSLATSESQYGPASLVEQNAQAAQSGWWRRWIPTYTDYRDDKVALFATYLPAGAYEYTFNARATLPGEYRVLPAYAEMMYFNEVWGRSEGSLFTVKK